MPNHRIIHTILTIGIAASWQAASMNVRACERCVVYLNSPACQDCVPAILPDDARTIDVQLAWTLEQNRPCVCRAVANLTLDLLASRPSISGQEYFGVLQRTACGQRIAAGLGPIAAGRNFHPYLSKDQVVLLKSAVAISSMDPDLAAGRRVIAKAAYLAGEIISAQIPSKDQDLRNLVGIPFFALSRGVLTDPGVFASKSSDQLTRLDRRIADEFEIHASSLSYYFGVTGPFYNEGHKLSGNRMRG